VGKVMHRYIEHRKLEQACNKGIISLAELKFYKDIWGINIDSLKPRQQIWKNIIDKRIDDAT
jgi:hypothetical protein